MSRPILVNLFALLLFTPVVSKSACAVVQSSQIPGWLRVHVGGGEGQIAQPVLQRARALYLRKVGEGAIRNPCYFAMDATRPHNLSDRGPGRRFYIICEAERSFRAISSGHGGGRHLKGIADFSNGRQCAKHFGNAEDSNLTAGGAYVTAETITSFKGYYRVSAKQKVALTRSFVQFEGEGETANARQREIGGHAAVLIRTMCRRKDVRSPHADSDGYVPFGTLENYADGRSNGCTSWSASDVGQILALLEDGATTLYIYPAAADVEAVARTVAAGHSLSRAGLYWNEFCLKEIGTPRFWSRENLEPVIARYKKDHPAPAPRPLPICKGP